MAQVMERIDRSGRRLAGVVHAAMVLDDAPLTQLDDERLRAVLTPKMTGALVLDRLCRERELDFLLSYSSGAALIGNLSQSAYVAGNLALESLVREHRRRGERALAVRWPAIADTGYVHRTGVAPALTALGILGLPAQEALGIADGLISREPHTWPDHAVAIGHLDWSAAARFLPTLTAPRTGDFVTAETEETQTDIRGQLAEATDEQARAIVEDALCALLARVLQTSPDAIHRDRRLDQIGVDSLMAAELSTLAARTFGCELPTVEITGAPGMRILAQRLTVRLGHSPAAPEHRASVAPTGSGAR